MREVQATQAKAHFAELLRTVEYGETVAITRHGRAIAHLTPARDQEATRRREAVARFRSARRRWRRIEMSTDEILAARREGHREGALATLDSALARAAVAEGVTLV